MVLRLPSLVTSSFCLFPSIYHFKSRAEAKRAISPFFENGRGFTLYFCLFGLKYKEIKLEKFLPGPEYLRKALSGLRLPRRSCGGGSVVTSVEPEIEFLNMARKSEQRQQ
jgi:hypothetical protein